MATKAPAATHPTRDEGALKSKKFLAYLIAELTSKALLAGGLYVLKNNLTDSAHGLWWWMITLTICTVFLEVGAILGIAYVDRFVRVAQLSFAHGKGLVPGGGGDTEEKTDPGVES